MSSPCDAVLSELEGLGESSLIFDYLIETADRFEAVPSSVATRPFPEEHRVPACESEAFIWGIKQQDGTVKFYFAVENPQGISAKAMAVILDECFSGVSPERVAEVDPQIVYRIFGSGISMGKGLGLIGMVNMVKSIAARV